MLASLRSLADKAQPRSFGFARFLRLVKPRQYQRVFAEAQRVGDRYFTILATGNGLDHARLGMAVSRKAAPKSVSRNRIKRAVRETFRLRQHELPAVDLVVLARPPAATADTPELQRALHKLWQRVRERCGTS